MMSFHDMVPDELQIPVLFSPDLRRMAILHSVVMVNDQQNGHHLQQLDKGVLKQVNQYIRENPHQIQCNDPQLSIARWQRTIFSPNGRFLAAIQSGQEPCVEDDGTEYYDSSVITYSNAKSDASPGWLVEDR
jgi:hypothetical protein